MAIFPPFKNRDSAHLFETELDKVRSDYSLKPEKRQKKLAELSKKIAEKHKKEDEAERKERAKQMKEQQGRK